MSWFLESPWPVLMLGLVLEIGLLVVFLNNGRAAVLGAMAAVLLLTLGLVAVERAVVTEREEVENALDHAAATLVSNDQQAVLALFATDCPRLSQVRSILPTVTIRTARVGGDLEVRVNRLTSPPSATAFFTGRVEAKDNRGSIPYENMIRKFKVKLQKQGGRWLIADYEDADIRSRDP